MSSRSSGMTSVSRGRRSVRSGSDVDPIIPILSLENSSLWDKNSVRSTTQRVEPVGVVEGGGDVGLGGEMWESVFAEGEKLKGVFAVNRYTPIYLTNSFPPAMHVSYVNEALRRGEKTQLGEEDWAENNDEDDAEILSTSIMNAWNKELAEKGPEKASLGFSYCVVLSLCALSVAILHHISWWITNRLGAQLRIQFITAIYKKCMRLSISHTSSSGYIVNLVANDVNRFEEAANFFLFVGIGPLLLVVVTALLYQQIENAAFVASFVTLLVIPVQSWVSKMFGVYRRACVEPRDARLKYISDMLNGIMMVKLYAWEQPLMENIDGLRKTEVKNMMKASILRAINLAFYQTFSCFIELFAFGSYHLMGGTLTPSKVFTTVVLLQSLKWNMGFRFPMGLQFSIESLVSFQRIQKFLMLPEIETTSTNVTDESIDPSIVLQLQNANKETRRKFQGTDEDAQTSREILKNISVTLRKSQMAVVIGPVGSGKSSLLNAVLREMECHEGSLYTPRNLRIAYASQTPWILSGTIRENILFGSTLDIEKLRRVIYACALEKDIELFEYGLETLVGERGVTLSGGQKARLALARACYSDADLLLLDDPLSAVDAKVGRHLFNECLNGLLKDRARVLVTHQLQYVIGADHVLLLENGEVTASGSYEAVMNTASSFSTVMKEFTERKGEEAEIDDDVPVVVKKAEKAVNVEDATVTDKAKTSEAIPTQFVKEEAAKGTVALNVYRDYFRAGASWFSIGILVLALALGNILLIMTDWWVGQWSSQADQNAPKWGWAFLGLTIVSLAVVVGRSLMFFIICIKSSLKLSQDIVQSVFGAEMRFFVENPAATLSALSTIILACSLLPIVLIIIPPMGYIFYKIRQLYVITSRQVKREEAITRSPVYATIPATLEGLSTVRAFHAQDRFIETFIKLQNNNTRISLLYISVSRWLGMRLDIISAAFLTLVVFATVGVSRVSSLQLSGANVGLILTYSLNLVGSLQWAFRQSAEEPGAQEPVVTPPPEWPSAGEIDVKIPAGSTVGIVGRTGAGKSSMLQALFRLVQPSGQITIDSLPTANIPLQTLRSSISIIPQDPFCFRGTLPLSSVQLEKTVSSLPGKLDAFVSENGGNWSVGERQLICLARAILKKSRVFVMDEATSAVDLNTDSLIAKVLRDKGGVFYGATTLTIAHRLNTIIDYNYVMVLDQGELVEFGVPHELLQKDVGRADAFFARLVSETGEEGQRVLSKMALDAYNERKN
ncbi:P-loop containing nucleoside triphosphate hydrolase protein [Rhizoclosmatium globosum]|uniref:p-loop containing nucleoside triphosphate hydrolase protein n=1 Tax=Rhizoclosmatium globosum TaxID=329046 RepID=A0A1Y2CVQ3_9FUNG|nr:P-loop containing nucleoside triphosphate hydrolase protein [Rhizoclosmatium globosum]|eukprot:ORY51103.1 P-loop containing nucleoside triphosphate hydrolase protein [Rhizoclosmatium globosum]